MGVRVPPSAPHGTLPGGHIRPGSHDIVGEILLGTVDVMLGEAN